MLLLRLLVAYALVTSLVLFSGTLFMYWFAAHIDGCSSRGLSFGECLSLQPLVDQTLKGAVSSTLLYLREEGVDLAVAQEKMASIEERLQLFDPMFLEGEIQKLGETVEAAHGELKEMGPRLDLLNDQLGELLEEVRRIPQR